MAATDSSGNSVSNKHLSLSWELESVSASLSSYLDNFWMFFHRWATSRTFPASVNSLSLDSGVSCGDNYYVSLKVTDTCSSVQDIQPFEVIVVCTAFGSSFNFNDQYFLSHDFSTGFTYTPDLLVDERSCVLIKFLCN